MNINQYQSCLDTNLTLKFHLETKINLKQNKSIREVMYPLKGWVNY